MSILVFDIETVPDIDLGKKLYDLDPLNDVDAVKALTLIHQQKNPNFKIFPLYLHKIVSISLILKSNTTFNVWSLGSITSNEKELLTRFFEGITKYTPVLVSWNGSNFDLPVVIYRALKHGITCPAFWETGRINPEFKWNNYLNKYHERHTDLMTVLATFAPQAYASLDAISTMLDLPGKMGVDGSKVLDMYLDKDLEGIRNYCELDVLNTYLVYLRMELIRGHYSQNKYQELIDEVKIHIKENPKPHLKQYLSAWESC